MQYGYTGKILKMNLSSGRFTCERHDAHFYRRYFGGRALAAYYLLKEIPPGIDPLAPENTLVFATSIGVGARVPGLSRYTVAAKSPLTNGFGETEAGGFWGPELKHAGFDALVITGKAERPSYLWIKDGVCELMDARHLWGKKTKEVQHVIRSELDDEKIRIAQTGPAGENLVRYAAVSNDLSHVNGRCGMGAVMGSKNLRAIAIRGTQEVPLHDADKVNEITRWFGRNFRDNPGNSGLHKWGTTMGLGVKNESGELPVMNFQTGVLPTNADQLYGEYIAEHIHVRSHGCFACPIACKRHVEDTSPYLVDPNYGSPEYETLGAFGGVCAVTSLNHVAKANELCNAYGLDTISTGASIAFGMECYEEGILSLEDTNGIDLAFGNAEALIEMIEKIVHREGIGDLLAEGTLRAAQKIGQGAEKYAMQVKGKELAFHDPRVKYDLALQNALSPSGADHVQADHSPLFAQEGRNLDEAHTFGIMEPVEPLDLSLKKVRWYTLSERWRSAIGSLGFCMFVTAPSGTFKAEKIVSLYRAITGWNLSLWEFMKLGERGTTMARAYNIREGFTAADDTIPKRMFEGIRDGPKKGYAVPREDFMAAIKFYYRLFGWDDNGIPTEETLTDLDVAWVSDLL